MPATAEQAEQAPEATERIARIARITERRLLPAPDLSAFELPDWPAPALAVTQAVWARRVENESQSLELAERILEGFTEVGALSPPIEAALLRLAEDERRHAELSRAFVRCLGGEPAPVEPAFLRPAEQPWPLYLLRCVATGLFVCETVSALRYATVRAHTTLPAPRAAIELFLRDEIAHARLGQLLLPVALDLYAAEVGEEASRSVLVAELSATFRHLERTIGLDAEPRGVPLRRRPQPAPNAGVVEPALDALAFYEAIRRTILPRLERMGIEGEAIWEGRFESP